MNKLFSLLRASLTEGMSLFRFQKSNPTSRPPKIVLPVFIAVLLILSVASSVLGTLKLLPSEQYSTFLGLTVFIVAALTVIQGTYKTSDLLFKCHDDNLLLSLPIKRSTILFLRIFKIYLFELLFSSLLLLPTFLIFIFKLSLNPLSSALLLLSIFVLPIIPVIIASIFGAFISSFSTAFKYKNLAQIIISVAATVAFVYFVFSFNFGSSRDISGLTPIVSKYYPSAFIMKLTQSYNSLNILLFLFIHFIISLISILILSKFYFSIISKAKIDRSDIGNRKVSFRKQSPFTSLVKKELGRFVSSPVFAVNSGIGPVFGLLAYILLAFNSESILSKFNEAVPGLTIETVEPYLPLALIVIICFSTFLSSITSSMISLEGQSFPILKSLPVSPSKIITAKIVAAMTIILPLIIIGELIVFFKFDLSFIEILILLFLTFVISYASQALGIIINLNYPKLNAENDAQVVKQSLSSAIAVFVGLGIVMLTASALVATITFFSPFQTLLITALAFSLFSLLLALYIKFPAIKKFNSLINQL